MEEREMIGAALAETRGRISGPSGAAAKLGIPHRPWNQKSEAIAGVLDPARKENVASPELARIAWLRP
jgi:hypothetical protein